jgi:putative spermidine/putrescine transport system substrate-binding protein
MRKGMRNGRGKSRPIKRRALEAASVVVAVLALMLGVAACGGDDNKSSSSAKGPDINAQGEGKLNIVNWEGYTDPSFVKGFEQETGCKVNDVFAGTSDEMFTKFRSGGGGQYDLASFSGDASLRAIKSGSVAELDTSKLTNYNDLAKQLQSPEFNTQDGKHYGLSFMWGANVLIYNADKIKDNIDSWNAIYDPKYKGKITVPNNPIQIADPALQFFGAQNPYAIDQATLDKVKAKLKQQRGLVRKYWVLATDFDDLFKSGDATIGAGWPLMTNDLRKAGLNVKEVLPKEGVTGWSDSWMLAKKARHPICAYKYMNYVTKPDIQSKVIDATGYSPANQKTCEVIGAQACKNLHVRDTKFYDSVKYWETPTAPTNYRQWTDAFNEVIG